MCEVEISAQAYVKMHLHAAQYPHCTVNGILLAERCIGGRMDWLCVTDCIPLFHNSLSLSVMLEVALNQIEMWSLHKQQMIVGYYQANSSLRDSSPNAHALKIVARISEYFKDAVLVMLENSRFSADCEIPPVAVFERRDSHWIPKDKNVIMWKDWDGTRQVCKALMVLKFYRLLVDFDSHLDDIRRDWANEDINNKILELTCSVNGHA
ncbi:ER membrane protein complex subunit 9 isoform X1 [Protopterus annectens]|uniref:ER membrane protein complex subunit 9 isoform X1 n=1 Tax=Protopterus annectens TaxID=7888 RepID=UPI001CFBDE3F|nr:ER membrane protein complex subunit 9 isoform X1 [Protopterus annectens]XP_043914684.1 ER membrane protein complex subunit 9 isoform X1 [Protopterus annectens]XP_043914685.1 ER membrane protein complex subunit 9 isoform X1 [Protopterus annectens]